MGSQGQDKWLENYHSPVDFLIDEIANCKSLEGLNILVNRLSKAEDIDKPYLRLVFNKKKRYISHGI